MDQAAINQRKINKAITSVAWQGLVLTTVVYATVMGNSFADTMVNWFVGIWTVVGLSFLFIAKRDPEELAADENFMERIGFTFTPTGKVLRVLAFCVSIVEITLFVKYGMFWAAAVWFTVEVLQGLTLVTIRRACWIYENADIQKKDTA